MPKMTILNSLLRSVRCSNGKSAGESVKAPKRGRGGSPKAAEMAAQELDRLGDKAATGEERASRKRRLIAGPKEFRGIRRK